MATEVADLRPERILELTSRLENVAGEKIGEISQINRAAKMLAINALIVAARAGESGKGFAVVAEEFKKISAEIDTVAKLMESQVKADLTELTGVGSAILEQLRGQRLADLALNAIEIIDRNLYERTCDVRWWATDSAVVDAVSEQTPEAADYAARRLKVILDAYTVYLDLWICDPAGKVIANGRPDQYPSARGHSVATAPWFQSALKTKSGDDFTVCDIERVPVLKNAPVATYAAAIRQGGESHGKILGVLGVHFDWRTQAQAVVDGVRLTEAERKKTRVLILDHDRRVLASSDRCGELSEIIPLQVSGSGMGSFSNGSEIFGYAATPGYETYRGLGWYGCLVQREGEADRPPVARSSAPIDLEQVA